MSFLKGVATFIACGALACGGGAVGYGMATDWTYKAPQAVIQEEQPETEPEAKNVSTFALVRSYAEAEETQSNPVTSIINGLTDKATELSDRTEQQRQQLEELLKEIDN